MNTERNYSGIRDKMLSEGDLDKKELQKVLDIGLDFISEEINKNSQVSAQVSNESSDFQIYFPYATLARLVHQYQDAKRDDLTASESYKMFGRMKNYYIERLNIPADEKNTALLEEKIVETICCNYDLFEEDKYIDNIGKNMSRLANFAADIVPNNPRADIARIEHPLD